jgi:hypothetical protein
MRAETNLEETRPLLDGLELLHVLPLLPGTQPWQTDVPQHRMDAGISKKKKKTD